MGHWDMFDAFMERNKKKDGNNADDAAEGRTHIVEPDRQLRKSD